MRIETAYFVKPVHAPGRGPTRSTDTHFTVKAGFDISLDQQTGWVRVEKGGEVRLVPLSNVVCVVPLVEAAAKPADKPAAKPKGPAKFAET